MMRLLTAAKDRWLAGYSASFNTFLVVHSLFLVFTRLPGVFINTMMMAPDEGIHAVLSYNASFFVTGALCMYIAAYVLKRSQARVTAIIGIAAYLVLYLLIIMLGNDAPRYHYLIGFFNGLADGFYWISYGQLLTSALAPANRDRGLAVINVIGSVISLVVPLVAGIIISRVGGIGGYIVVMLIASAVAAWACVWALKLPRDAQSANDGAKRTDFIGTIRMIWQQPMIRSAIMGQWAKGIREGASMFLLSAVLYQILRSELIIGVNSFLSSFAGIVAFAYMSRVLTQENRMRFMLVAVIVLCAMGLLGLLSVSPWMLLLYSAVNAMFSGAITNGGYSIFLEALTAHGNVRSRYPEALAYNESFLVAGRCVGLGIIWLVNVLFGDSAFWNLFSLFILSASQFLTVLFSGRANEMLAQHRLTLTDSAS